MSYLWYWPAGKDSGWDFDAWKKKHDWTPITSEQSGKKEPLPLVHDGMTRQDWSKEAMAEFLLAALRLIQPALAARDLSEQGITRKTANSTIARQVNAAAGGPLLAPDEWDDLLGI